MTHGLLLRRPIMSLDLLSACSDVYWRDDIYDNRRLTGVYAIFYGDNLVASSARKHTMMSPKAFF
jgi:hypothetical protein